MSTAPQQAVAAPPRPRTKRATRIGVVTSASRQKTIGVTVSYQVRHAKYGKYLRRQTVLHAHDEKSDAKLGDTVEVAECRPMSRTKHWRLLRVVRRGAGNVPMVGGPEAVAGGGA
jgi:small subunit ribosomal protein S17